MTDSYPGNKFTGEVTPHQAAMLFNAVNTYLNTSDNGVIFTAGNQRAGLKRLISEEDMQTFELDKLADEIALSSTTSAMQQGTDTRVSIGITLDSRIREVLSGAWVLLRKNIVISNPDGGALSYNEYDEGFYLQGDTKTLAHQTLQPGQFYSQLHDAVLRPADTEKLERAERPLSRFDASRLIAFASANTRL